MTDAHNKTTIVHVDDSRAIAATPMHPLVDAARDANGRLDPSVAREFIAMQRDWEANEARKAFTRALAGLKRDLPTVIARDATVDFVSQKGRTHYTHASLAQVMGAITAPLTAHGFSLAWTTENAERGGMTITCTLTHQEGHSTSTSLTAPADTSGNKNPAQAIASTCTLLQRYTALALLGIATADMVEPTGEQAPPPADHIDVKKNLAAASAIVEAGLRREDAEKHVGRRVSEWTAADRETLRTWFKANRPVDPSTGELSAEEEERMAGET